MYSENSNPSYQPVVDSLILRSSHPGDLEQVSAHNWSYAVRAEAECLEIIEPLNHVKARNTRMQHEYGKIAKSYANFTIRHYGSATKAAFDGCEEEPPIKDDTHQKTCFNIQTIVSFTAEADYAGKKEECVSRDKNKHRLNPVISDELRERECHVVNEKVW